jgi:hypothetical protein
MSVTELIRQVAALPPEERVLFERLLRAVEDRTAVAGRRNQPAWPDFGERLRSIYGDKVAPDSTSLVAEGRGDL